jgi:hypothetical protein
VFFFCFIFFFFDTGRELETPHTPYICQISSLFYFAYFIPKNPSSPMPCVTFHNKLTFLLTERSCYPRAQTPSWKTTSWQLSATSYSIYWQPPSNVWRAFGSTLCSGRKETVSSCTVIGHSDMRSVSLTNTAVDGWGAMLQA